MSSVEASENVYNCISERKCVQLYSKRKFVQLYKCGGVHSGPDAMQRVQGGDIQVVGGDRGVLGVSYGDEFSRGK